LLLFVKKHGIAMVHPHPQNMMHITKHGIDTVLPWWYTPR